MKLEIKHFTSYLPHNIEVQYIDCLTKKKRKAYLTGVTNEGVETTYKRKIKGCGGGIIPFIGYNNIQDLELKLLLRPLSYLTKEIEHNGEKFIPLVELAKIAQVYSNEDIIRCETVNYDTFKHYSCNELHFLVETENLGSLHYMFNYTKEIQRFALRDNTRRRPLSFINQLDIFQKMYEWHFDLNQLIDQDLVININDNPS